MVDLFGIKKEKTEHDAADAGEGREASADQAGSGSRQKLWGALLVVDTVLLIIFGGAVAAKLYQHLCTPVSVAPAARIRPGKSSAAAAAPASAPGRPGAGAAAPPAVAAKPQPAAVQTTKSEAPSRQAAGASAPPAAVAKASKPAAAGEKPHSVPVEFKLKSPNARSVQLAGAFIVRGGGRREMVQQDDGVWTLTLYLLPGTKYLYWFVVNGKKTLDPGNSQAQRGASILVLP